MLQITADEHVNSAYEHITYLFPNNISMTTANLICMQLKSSVWIISYNRNFFIFKFSLDFLLCIQWCHPLLSSPDVLPLTARCSVHWAPPAPASRSDNPSGSLGARSADPSLEESPRAPVRTDHTQSSLSERKRRTGRGWAQPSALFSSSEHASPGTDASPAEEDTQGENSVFRWIKTEGILIIFKVF